MAPKWRYSGDVATIQIKNVPEEVHKEMQRRAKRSGKSLQQYLLEDLCRSAGRLPMDEWLERVASHKGGSTLTGEKIVRLVREDRDSR